MKKSTVPNAVKSADGRLWVVIESQSDRVHAVVRALHMSNGRRWLGHRAVFTRTDLNNWAGATLGAGPL